jgi:indolepyruvate ferredoxin oxidoreductase, alpha subunit
MTELMSGNAAIARGAYEAGVTFASGYPGTPSTEILESAVAYQDVMYLEWSPNEKVALEVAVGASLSGARSMVTMKHVGLNVAADPLMTFSYIGGEGGCVIVVADDPGMHSSQNEQDSRHYAAFAKVPLFEPSDSQEAKDFVQYAIELSEQHRTPVLLRSTTRISHSRSLVRPNERVQSPRPIGFQKNPQRYVTVPLFARPMREAVECRTQALLALVETHPANRIEWRGRQLGVVTSSISYQYVREVFPDATVLKLGLSWPVPDGLIRRLANHVEEILVVEELDDLLETHIRSLGISCRGRELVPGIGELSPDRLDEAARALGGTLPTPSGFVAAEGLPPRPPVLCPGCPHRGVFSALGKHDVVVTGDIGCYSLGAFRPLDRLDVILCMGGGISMAHGADRAGEPKKVVGVMGDSTFFHSGMTGLLDMAYNRSAATVIVLDNRTTAMTGHQDHPGTGMTLRGERTVEADIAAIARACGIQRVREILPYDAKATAEALAEELDADEPSLIVAKAPCPLQERKPVGDPRRIDADRCTACGACLKLGCPAIERSEGGKTQPTINEALCGGCSLCEQTCRFAAIAAVSGEVEA